MGLPSSTEARTYYRAAQRRFADAEALLVLSEKTGAHTTGAMYMGGYAVECMLKCLILERTPKSQKAATIARFRGSEAHNFDVLKELYRKRGGGSLPADVRESLIRVNSWTTEWRYKAALDTYQDANSFLNAVKTIFDWADGRL